jgi:predicted site-specific integrase-resolvase
VDALLRVATHDTERCAVYDRFSPAKQAEDGNLQRPKDRLVKAVGERRYEITVVVAGRASDFNEKRRGLRRLLRMATEGEIDVVLVEFNDRLARFGFTYLVEAFAVCGVRLEVLDGPMAIVAGQPLVADMLAIVTCFAAGLYGSRSQEFRPNVQTAAKETEGRAG